VHGREASDAGWVAVWAGWRGASRVRGGARFRGDVAVGLHEPISEMVTEAPSLSDFGNVIGDEPGLMAMPEPMKRQVWSNRHGALSAVAVNGGSKHAAVENAASQRVT
jgi:hypothetical protein